MFLIGAGGGTIWTLLIRASAIHCSSPVFFLITRLRSKKDWLNGSLPTLILWAWGPTTRGVGGGGGGDRGSYSIPPKNHNFRICLPKKITTFLAYPKNPSVCFFPLKELVQSPYKLVDKQDTSWTQVQNLNRVRRATLKVMGLTSDSKWCG